MILPEEEGKLTHSINFRGCFTAVGEISHVNSLLFVAIQFDRLIELQNNDLEQ